MIELPPPPRQQRQAEIVWIDPGVTTGLVVLRVRPRWLDGAGDVTWRSLGAAVSSRWFGQIGRHARVLEDGRPTTPPRHEVITGFDAVTMRKKITSSQRSGSAEMTTGLYGELEQVLEIGGLLDLWPDAVWGYEDFIPRSANASREFLAPIRIFSTVTADEVLNGEKGRVPFVQDASMAKNTATDERLKEANLYIPGMPHATDAARHAATFLRRARQDPELRAAAWPRLFKSTVKEESA